MKKTIKIMLSLCILYILSVSHGYANASYSYEQFSDGFENGLGNMMYKTEYSVVPAPQEANKYGNSVKVPYSTSSDNFIGPKYDQITNYFDASELKDVKVSVDVLFEDYIGANLRFLSNARVGANLFGFAKSGKFTSNYSSQFTNQTNWASYENYSLDTWYNISIELNLENQTFSLYINGDEITVDTAFTTDSGADMEDFMHFRVNVYKNSTIGEIDRYIYVDNISYYIPYSYVYKENAIDLSFDYSETIIDYDYEQFSDGFENGIGNMVYKTEYAIVPAPQEANKYGNSVKVPYSTSSDNFIGPKYEKITNYFNASELKHVRVGVDILLEDNIGANLRFLSNARVGASLFGFAKSGKFTSNYSSQFTNQTNWASYENYSLDTWYNISIELNLENQTFSLYINGDEITVNTAFTTDSGADMEDFMHFRVNVYKNSVTGETDKYIYIDNFSYYIPYGYIDSSVGIGNNKKIVVNAYAPHRNEAVLIAAQYEDGVLTSFTTGQNTFYDDVWASEYSCYVENGVQYRFFLFDSLSTLKPLCQGKVYYSYSDLEYELEKKNGVNS